MAFLLIVSLFHPTPLSPSSSNSDTALPKNIDAAEEKVGSCRVLHCLHVRWYQSYDSMDYSSHVSGYFEFTFREMMH